jgi:cell wall-associated NlpC family hydrolase
LIYLPEDRRICETLLRSARSRQAGALPFPEIVAAAARAFLDAPYAAGTLEREGPEELVINLRAFDCVTLVESAVALATLIGAGKTGFAGFAAALERIRYRGGVCDGYPSRLHYFTDWLFDNGRRAILRDVTRELGGIPFRKRFHALTDRRNGNPALKDEEPFRRMRAVERGCSRRSHHFIPKDGLNEVQARIAEGDIIAITTDAPGLDVSHAGIAVRVGRSLRLLHASSAAGKVVLSGVSLAGYLKAKPGRTGIIVGRVISGGAAKKR